MPEPAGRWHFNTGAKITASPMSYSFRGRQYVALTAGSNVIAFGLPEGMASPESQVMPAARRLDAGLKRR